MAKLTGLAKLAAAVNRKSTGAPKGRKDDATKAEMAAARKKYGSKLKPGKVSKSASGPGTGIIAKARKAQLDKKIRESGG